MKSLNNAIEQQIQLLGGLLSLLQRETNELSEVHLDAMAEINTQKEELSSRIADHATILRNAVQEAASREGLSANATLGELAQAVQQKGNREIARLHAELNATAARVKEVLALNREIAERFAASVTSSLELLTRLIKQSNTYGASGGYQQQPTSSVMINREA